MKIKSITDVITNSSTEVFVMTSPQAEYWRNKFISRGLGDDFSSEVIDYEWVESNLYWEFKLICKVFGLDEDLIVKGIDDLLDEKTQGVFLELNTEKLLGSSLLGEVELVSVTDKRSEDLEALSRILEDIRDYDGLYHEDRH